MEKKNTNGGVRNVIHEHCITVYGPMHGTNHPDTDERFLYSLLADCWPKFNGHPRWGTDPLLSASKVYCIHTRTSLDHKPAKIFCGKAYLRRCPERKDNKHKVTALKVLDTSAASPQRSVICEMTTLRVPYADYCN
jgi:hypothetical protein